MHRRRVIQALAAAGWAGFITKTRAVGVGSGSTLIAAWDDPQGRHHAGLLSIDPSAEAGTPAALSVLDEIELPTRAHGLLALPDGSVLVVARRPGEWLLRWRPGVDGPAAVGWFWLEADRRLCGHAVLDDQGRLLTTEMDLENDRGLVVVRDACGFATLAEWPTGGIDPHELSIDGSGHLLVANGGVPTRPETGRSKLDRAGMDSSLVRLAADDGRRLGQWRLDDARLSIRHLARHAGGRVGVALQAEHDDAAARDAAPLLAVFDGCSLQTASAPLALAGYGGSIVAEAGGFAVAATRAGQVARWSADGRWRGNEPLADACPAALLAGRLVVGGSSAAVLADPLRAVGLPALRLDNHWVAGAG